MSRVHVFAVDWFRGIDDIGSGGALRSLQIIEALREGGHDVTVSYPRQSRMVQATLARAPGVLRGVLLHDDYNQQDILQEVRADAVAWLWPSIRNVPFSGLGELVHICDLNGVQDFEIANGAEGMLRGARGQVIDACQGADLVLTGSPEQDGFWTAELARNFPPPDTAMVPYALPPAFRGEPAARGALSRLHYTGNFHAWNDSIGMLRRVAAWADGRSGISLTLIYGPDPGRATDVATLAALRELERHGSVEAMGEVSFRQAMEAYGPGSLALDLYAPSLERRLSVPIRTVNALAHGVPSLTNVDGPLMGRLVRAGAAAFARDDEPGALEATLDRLAELPPDAFAAMGTAARAFADRCFDPREAASALLAGLDKALARRRRSRGGVRPGGRLGRVLVITAEGPNLREVRIDLPMGALYRKGLIGGYAVWSQGRIQASTGGAAADDRGFDAIWVQRVISPEIALALHNLDRPYVYDIDDNLLISPGYRPAFSPETMQAARNFVRRCAVLSCSTARLAGILQRLCYAPVVGKTVVTPNLARRVLPKVAAGEPSCVIWASSDTPALTESRLAVLRAVRDFCLARSLRLICVGNPPPAILRESDVEIEHVGMLPYSAYLAMLASLAPAIMVCPLETQADPATRDFVDGKSDIKVLEALTTGVVGVFSAAAPYADSDLPQPILCSNDYRGWFDGMTQARRQCLNPQAQPAIPPARMADQEGTAPWLEAMERARLARPIRVAEFEDALRLIRGRFARRRLSEQEFDEAYYVARYPDVREYLEHGKIASAYEHYLGYGYDEQRLGREGDVTSIDGAQWWANVMHTLGDVRAAVANRTPQIEEFKARRNRRLRERIDRGA